MEESFGCSRPWVPAAAPNSATPNFVYVRLAPGEWALFFEDNLEPEFEDAARGRLMALALKQLRFEMEGTTTRDKIRDIVIEQLLMGAEQRCIERDQVTKRWSLTREFIDMLDRNIEAL